MEESGPGMPFGRRARLLGAGAGAAASWLVLVWVWFDVSPARSHRHAGLTAGLLAATTLLFLGSWLYWRWARGARRAGRRSSQTGTVFWLPVVLAVVFRLPFLAQGAAAAVTPDGALSGIVMLRVLAGTEHFVFVPNVPYSGSFKSHLAALFALALDPARAFALTSVLFYALFVAAVVRLAALVPGDVSESGGVGRAEDGFRLSDPSEASRGTVLVAGLYATFAPPFVTRYSLSNDGNYVEVLALGSWALLLGVRWISGGGKPAEETRTHLALLAGLLLGLAFWCHILAVIPLAAVALACTLFERRAALRSLPPLCFGWALGNAPGLLWNLTNRGESFRYLLPGGPKVGGEESGSGLLARAWFLVTDQLPVLFGYDTGYGPVANLALLVLGWAGLTLFAVAVVRAVRAVFRERDPALVVLLVFGAVNVTVALLALPYIAGNARYVLFLTGPAAVLLAWAFARAKIGRVALALLIAGGAVASLAQLPGTARGDQRWRGFVADLEAQGVRFCYTDFYLATKINFLSGERVVCSAKLGPTTTEYFFEYRREVESAPGAALVAVNTTAARKLEERLSELGVPFVRLDSMKPVLLPSRKVDPAELFPNREFPLR